ncbi:MAG: FMN-binding protein [Gammaproteobacteria bacterium WSBS_2016_MAG_OTU1]
MVVIKHGLTLALAAAAALALALIADAFWRQTIEDNRRQYEQRLLLETLSGVVYTRIVVAPQKIIPKNLSSAEIVQLWRVVNESENSEETVAIAVRIVAHGYGGEIVFIAAFDSYGQRLQSRIVRHVETPGIADFLLDKNGGERAINGVSGATITSNALSAAASDIADWIKQHSHIINEVN